MLCCICSNSGVEYINKKANTLLCNKLICYVQFQNITNKVYFPEDFQKLTDYTILLLRKKE